MLKVDREGIRRGSLAEYAFYPVKMDHQYGHPLNSFDMHPPSGFRRAKFIPRFEAHFANGPINDALKTGMFCTNSDAGQTSFLPTGSVEVELPYRVPGRPSGGDEMRTCFAHSPTKGGERICCGHTSRRSLPRGSSFSLPHGMIPTKSLRWLTKARLS